MAQDSSNKGIYLKRTEHLDGDGTKEITRNGNALALPLPFFGVEDFSVGFWFKRDLVNDRLTSDPDRQGPFIALNQDAGFGSTTFDLIGAGDLPNDDDWHFLYLTLEAPAAPSKVVTHKLYVDGAATPVISRTFTAIEPPGGNDLYQELYIGAGGRVSDAYASPSSVNGTVDDIIVWGATDQTVADQAADIAVFGMSKFDPSEPDLVIYHGCDDLESIPWWFEGSVTRGTKQADIADNEYGGWFFISDISSEVEPEPSSAEDTGPVVPRFVDTSGLRHQTVQVTVSSPYRLGVEPPVGTNERQLDPTGASIVRFTAPEYIFLDRYYNEIGQSDDPNPAEFFGKAYYRAKNLGYAIERGADAGSQGTHRFFSQPLSEPISVTWRWDLEYALYLESDTSDLDEVDAGSLGTPTINGSDTTIGLHWLAGGTHLRTGIDAIIGDDSEGTGLPARYETRGFTVENAPTADDHYLDFDGEDSVVEIGSAEFDAPTSFSIDFWARRDERDTGDSETLVSFRGSGNPGGDPSAIRVGFRATTYSKPAAMFIRFATPEKSISFDLPAALSDGQWHHWAWTFDADTNVLLAYRDGVLVGSRDGSGIGELPEITGSSLGMELAEDVYRHPYGGGINNLRFWSEALGDEGVAEALATPLYGPGTDGLEMEFSFDKPDLSTITSDEGNALAGALMGFGQWGDNRVLRVDKSLAVLVPSTGVDVSGDGNTVEARVYFPLAVHSGTSGRRALFNTHNAEMIPVVFNQEGELGFIDHGEFIGTSFFTDHLRGWHMVSAVSADGRTTYYIDGQEMGNVDTMLVGAIHGIGNNNDGKHQQVGIIDEVRIWDTDRKAGEIRDAAETDLTGTETDLQALWDFDDDSVDFDTGEVTDRTGNGNTAVFSGGAEPAVASTELPVDAQLAVVFPTFSERVLTPDEVPGDRIQTDQYVVQDWMRITWQWSRTLQVKVAASPPAYQHLVYLVADGQVYQGSDADEVWVDEGTDVVVGAQHRTADRCFTLSDLAGQTNAFSAVTMDTIGDGISPSGAAARAYEFPALEEPGSIVFSFAETTYRAVLPLGAGLDGSSTEALSAQLVPALCDEAHIEVGSKPDVTKFDASQDGGSGDAVEWDSVNLTLLPVQPGNATVGWPGVRSGVSHAVELAAGFPNTTIEAGWEIEDAAGFRLDADGNRIIDSGNDPTTQVTLPPVGDAFPGSPGVHYPVVFRSGETGDIPVDLDLETEDRWYFDRMSFSATGTAVDPNSNRLTATAAGKSVLLYTYRPDPTEVATGDRGREGVAVRVIDAVRVEDHTQSGDALVSDPPGLYQELRLTSDRGQYAENSAGSGNNFGFSNNVPHSLEFWFRLDEIATDPVPERIAFEVYNSSYKSTTRFGIRAGNHATNPGGLFYSVTDDDTKDPVQEIEFPQVIADTGWHHLAVVTDSTDQVFYLDGTLIGAVGEPFPHPDSQLNLLALGYSTTLGGGWLEGAIDNLRIWKSALDTAGVRTAMTSWDANNSEHWFAVSFDLAVDPTKLHQIPKDGGTASGNLIVRNPDRTEGLPADVLELQSEDGPAEVATRLDSKLDTAGLGAGFIINANSNYNNDLYDRAAPVGGWGGVFPVNWGGLFTGTRELVVAYYENPYRSDPAGLGALHPNVAWPYAAVDYTHVTFPEIGPHRDKRIYIASRLGTEGVDANGDDQLVFDPAVYTGVKVYNQPDRSATGFNPNEEHALTAPSIKDQLTGDGSFDLGQEAAFALQNQINHSDVSDTSSYTSDPWVLVQFQDVATGAWDMAAYKVETTRTGGGDRANDLFPQLDPVTHQPVDADGVPVDQPADPMYDFDYPAFAGDVYIPPYPLNLVVGNAAMANDTGGNVGVDGVQQRTLWNDKDGIAWVVSGDGVFFYENWYPLRDDFWFFADSTGANALPAGTELAWLPPDSMGMDSFLSPSEVLRTRYATYWRDGYPVLKRGETATYSGGENLVDHPAAEGLPAFVAMASAEVVFDSRTPTMVFEEGTEDDEGGLNGYSARVTRPLDRRVSESTVSLEVMGDAALTPANTEQVHVVRARWYFKALTGSLQKRFYYDALTSQLVFRGLLNDLEGGSPDITKTPISLYALEPNVLSAEDYTTLLELPVTAGATVAPDEWVDVVQFIYAQSQNPSEIEGVTVAIDPLTDPFYWSGVQVPFDDGVEQFPFFTEDVSNSTPGSTFTADDTVGETDYQNLSSLGVGSALVPNPTLLSAEPDGPLYVTLVENNHPDVSGAVTLHIIEVGESRFRGAVKLVEAQDVFSERVNLRHTADFGGNTGEAYYEWWAHDVAPLDTVGTPDGTGTDGWQRIDQGLGLNQIEFSGRPDLMISDKLFFVRYGEGEELGEATDESGNDLGNDPEVGDIDPASWRKVAFQLDGYEKEAPDERVPFQWAGAFNSPQLQADGSKREVPQLVMGWVKRVLDRINPYEARYGDFAGHDSPATYSSMIQIAGAPFNGKVALNSDKDVVENVGLIQLYETVLLRAKELTIDEAGAATSGTNQALLLAATRLAILYELLAREAYSDAQIPTVLVTPDNGLDTVATFIHAFYNQEASLLDEELALLRGTDFVKAYPSYNRLFWNYVKGLGEAAYNANYRIHDTDSDGFINESDAAELYPQGHGDAWGHFLSASRMHYDLLTDGNKAFVWEAKDELYGLLDNVIEVDYLDEKSFARIAAAKARTGKEIVTGTYRAAYTEDPDGQWQGYQDADAARAWGVTEWGARAGQASLFDWVVANALVPAEADEDAEGLERIDRITNAKELAEVAAAYHSIQETIDRADGGDNPLGFDSEAITFDLDPLQLDGNPAVRHTHFDQVYERAVGAARNALTALENASSADQQLARTSDDTFTLQVEALRQDIDYRNRLIEIFGTPYEGTVGPGQVYPEGYLGPDTVFYQYIDFLETEDYLPGVVSSYSEIRDELIKKSNSGLNYYISTNFVQAGKVADVYKDYFSGADSFTADSFTVEAPLLEGSDFAFQAPESWGERDAYGRIQNLLNDLVAANIDLEIAVEGYEDYVNDLLLVKQRFDTEVDLQEKKLKNRVEVQALLIGSTRLRQVAEFIATELKDKADFSWRNGLTVSEGYPRVSGTSNDVTFAARRFALEFSNVAAGTFDKTRGRWEYAAEFSELVEELTETIHEYDESTFEAFSELVEAVENLADKLHEEESYRVPIAKALARIHALAGDIRSAESEGLRLLEERGAYNAVLAAKTQQNRYSDMALRITRNDALQKYQSAFEHALRYAWLAAKAYEYETSLDPGDAASAAGFLEGIVSTRHLGYWDGGEPSAGNGGVAELLAQMKANFDVLKGQLGINNPQNEAGRLSLRSGHFKISTSGGSDGSWRTELAESRVDDLWAVPEFRRFCRPFADPADGAQPGLVIEFSTDITPGYNAFGNALAAGDSSFSAANFATKVRSAGVLFEGYNDAGSLTTTPRVYLVPVGTDRVRVSTARNPEVRDWEVVEQRIPVPFAINETQLRDPNFIPSIDTANGTFNDLRRHGDFLAYDADSAPADARSSSLLVGRSVWNTRWLLIIPGAALGADADAALDSFIGSSRSGGVEDIYLEFETYSHEGS